MGSSRIVERNLKCINLECGSHDALQKYEEGTGYCFSCSTFFSKQQMDEGTVNVSSSSHKNDNSRVKETIEDLELYDIGEIKDRGISYTSCKYMGVKVSQNKHFYPYANDAWKVRIVASKDFYIIGNKEKVVLFGENQADKGRKLLVITEGEIDALSVIEACVQANSGTKPYATVSIASATILKPLADKIDFIRSFQNVVIFVDNPTIDKAGKAAQQFLIKLVGVDRARIPAYLEGCKDANDVLLKHGALALLNTIRNAQPYRPDFLVSGEDLWKSYINIQNLPTIPYPPILEELNKKLRGLRLHEISVWTSGTGCGKSTLIRSLILYLLQTTKDKIGFMALEEGPGETVAKFLSVLMGKDLSDEDYLDTIKEENEDLGTTYYIPEEIKKVRLEERYIAFKKLSNSNRLLLYNHGGAISDSSVIDRLEIMALSGCKYLFIDHITMLISEGFDKLEGNEAQDKLMNELLKLTKKYPIHIGIVSHLRKTTVAQGASFESGRVPKLDDLKGSGSLKQVGMDIIGFSCDKQNEDPLVRSTIFLHVLKSRTTGRTGEAGVLRYNAATCTFEIPKMFD